MIQYLEWDSNFFGYKIGKIDVNINFEQLTNINSDNYKLLYIFSKKKIKIDLNVIDNKVVFKKELFKTPDITNIEYFDKNVHSSNDLRKLALLSGKFSRFNIDTNFKNNEFKKLYTRWLDNSINYKIAFAVIVKIIDNKLAGFVTVGAKNNNTSQIGLIAVKPEFQGRGVASILLKMAEIASINKGYRSLEVATQGKNVPAMKLYQKNSYFQISSVYIYHLWL